MSKESIRLHPKHGLNPSLETCYICGKEKGSILLLGASYKGEAPRHICVNKEPCDACKKYMEKGVILLEVLDGSTGSNPARTGNFWVVTREASENLGITSPVAYITKSDAENIGLYNKI